MRSHRPVRKYRVHPLSSESKIMLRVALVDRSHRIIEIHRLSVIEIITSARSVSYLGMSRSDTDWYNGQGECHTDNENEPSVVLHPPNPPPKPCTWAGWAPPIPLNVE